MATLVKKRTNGIRNLVVLLALLIGLFWSIATAANMVQQIGIESGSVNHRIATLDESYRLTAEAPR